MGACIDLGLIQQTFMFVRHGQTDWNRNNLAMGQTDVPLNRQGTLEAHDLAQVLSKHEIKLICHSPLSRAASTAHILGRHLDLPTLEIKALSQCNWGSMQGHPRGDESWRMAWRRGELQIDGAETFNEFAHRVCGGMNQALSYGIPVLIVAHGATFAAIQRTLGLPDRELRNCAPLQYLPPQIVGGKWQQLEL